MEPSTKKASDTGERPTPSITASASRAMGIVLTRVWPALFTVVIARRRIPAACRVLICLASDCFASECFASGCLPMVQVSKAAAGDGCRGVAA